MDKKEVEKCAPVEDGTHLNRNRSFKTKQLVRSQAIRESTSPPRTVSPSVRNEAASDNVTKNVNVNKVNVKVTAVERTGSDSSHDSDVYSYSDKKDRRKPVEIQITQGAWDENPPYEHRGRTKRWLSDSSRESTRDLLSNNPRVACVCGACAACPHCRGRRRRHICTIKQDSGICPDECAEGSDTEPNGVNNENIRKTGSLDVDEQYYCRCPERRDKPKNMLSRTDSDEKTEPTGPELVSFIKETLNKNGKDRTTLLKIEKELHSLINDTGRCIVKFPVMTSYGRMLVHRCAALFQLSHHLDHSNKNCVIVSKSGTSGGRLPCTNFKTWCVANFPPPSPQRHPPDQTIVDGANAKSILKRDTHSLDEPSSGALAMSRSKSLEQREREYERVRRRIFSTDNCNQDESQWPWLNAAGPVKLLAPDGRNKLLKVQSLETSAPPQLWRGRGGAVSKSHSFGGYGEPQPPTRALSRQGDLASSSWRLSPSSSGYKTLSLRSTDSVTPSPTGGGTPEPAPNCPSTSSVAGPCSGPVVWAVTDMACVPAGALVIHPQTGRPLTNPDGSVYHFDPSNPPILYDPGDYEEVEPAKIDQNNAKRRGRLEKQHSFIDHEAECQQVEQFQYEYEVHENQEKTTGKETPKPVTPTKSRYDPPLPTQEFTNLKPPEPAVNPTPETQPDGPANQRPYESRNFELANQREPKAGSYQDTVYYGPYANLNQGYNEEVRSPPQMTQYMQPDMTHMHNIIPQAKVAPILQDPNIRSMTNMLYPTNIPTGYHQFIPNQCRVEPLHQQLYQPMLQQQVEEQKVTSPQHPTETTFRIDPSYPYSPMDYTTAYGGCVDPTPAQSQPQPQRSYSVPYNPAELGAMPPVYPLGNVIQPQLIQYPMQYPDAMQWSPLQTQSMCQVVYPQHYAHYNILYPQVIPQPYPICQPIYPLLDNRRKRNSLPSARLTPITTPEEKPFEKFDRENSEIAAKINQIKEGMLQREGVINSIHRHRKEDWKRNSGNGILGSYPVNNFNGRISGGADNAQLTSAARAIVNSIRHLQAKNTYHQDRRYEYNHSNQCNYERTDYRRRYEERGDNNGKGDGNNVDRHSYKGSHYHEKNCNNQDRIGNNQDRISNNPDMISNNQDRISSNPDMISNNPDRSRNNQDGSSNNQDRSSNNPDRISNNPDMIINNPDRSRNNQESSSNNQDRSSNNQDRSSNNPDRISNNQNRISNNQDMISNNPDRSRNNQDRISNNQDRSSNTQDRNAPYRHNSYQDKNSTPDSNAQDRTNSYSQDSRNAQDRSNVSDKNSNDLDKMSNTPDSQLDNTMQDQMNSVQERHSNVQDIPAQGSNAQDRTQSNAQERNSFQERNNGQDSRNFQDRGNYLGQERPPWQDRKYAPRNQAVNPGQYKYRPPYLFRQVSPGTWCARSPAPVHPGFNHPRRPYPDNRNGRRY